MNQDVVRNSPPVFQKRNEDASNIYQDDGDKNRRGLYVSRKTQNKQLLPFRSIADIIIHVFTNLISNVYTNEIQLLFSVAPCQAQVMHADYSYQTTKSQMSALHMKFGVDMPLSVIVSLLDHSSLVVWPGSFRILQNNFAVKTGSRCKYVNKVYEPEHLRLNAGDVVIFRPDLVHAGSAYGSDNLRLHLYLSNIMKSKQHLNITPNSVDVLHDLDISLRHFLKPIA
jgi:ectoine hydroxylase-related dioxygenase (phytanoyl-CoA dioxygenase family)